MALNIITDFSQLTRIPNSATWTEVNKQLDLIFDNVSPPQQSAERAIVGKHSAGLSAGLKFAFAAAEIDVKTVCSAARQVFEDRYEHLESKRPGALLPLLNRTARAVEMNKGIPDNIREFVATIYTMATAPEPLTFDKAALSIGAKIRLRDLNLDIPTGRPGGS